MPDESDDKNREYNPTQQHFKFFTKQPFLVCTVLDMQKCILCAYSIHAHNYIILCVCLYFLIKALRKHWLQVLFLPFFFYNKIHTLSPIFNHLYVSTVYNTFKTQIIASTYYSHLTTEERCCFKLNFIIQMFLVCLWHSFPAFRISRIHQVSLKKFWYLYYN